MALAQPLPRRDPNAFSAERISADNAEESIRETLLGTSEKEQLPRLPLPHSGLNLKSTLKIVLVLFLAISYLTFCGIVHYHNVPIGGSGVLGLPFIHFTTEAGITTIAISVVTVALWPIHGVIDEIRSEEFFRLLRIQPSGLPLDSVNAVSAPTTGAFDIFLATFRRRCSPLLTYSLITTLLIAATSTLAPAALDAVSILIDVDDPAFQVGALINSSSSDSKNLLIDNVYHFTPLASSLSWVENVLNITTNYRIASSEDNPFGYVVPFPPGYTTVTQAYWTTDIILLNPSCSWQTPHTARNSIDVQPFQPDWLPVTLPDANLTFNVTPSNNFVEQSQFPSARGSVVGALVNTTSNSTTLDGSVVFVISQLQLPQLPYSANLSNIPTLEDPSEFGVLAFLLCNPHASIQTHKVWTGNGILTLGQPQRTQGNLDLDLVNYILSSALNDFATSSGPLQSDVGTDMMVRLMFGDNFQPGTNMPPAPLTNITVVYKQIIQSAMKTFLSGAVATAIVPGGSLKEQLVFASSLGHVITSAILFALLTMVLVVAQFRPGRDAFTLIDVAAALADSDAPQKCLEMKQLAGAGERKALRLVSSGDGGLNCTYQRFD
ncbi:hypothetical protein GALMADRAFT_259061 [Galerina marginata CBS 339.88]|uniref:Uncharacterized protein n=1 Tax=Galerina marginata (strain CBS 339.88) TaxID=685588 RepID=A0A067S6R8_GALM3|nr:hypothetical protein GALMADRAFT_259061 [Galerina marginata CBS 339.88]